MITDRYRHWVNILGSYLFNRSNSQYVMIYMTKQELIDEYKRNHNNLELEDVGVWNSFVKETNAALSHHSGNIADAIQVLRNLSKTQENTNKYPLYLPVLVLFVMARAEKEHENNRNVYTVIKGFFDENELIGGDQISTQLFKSLCSSVVRGAETEDGGIWKELKTWSKKHGHGVFIFTLDSNTKVSKQRYANLLKEQCLLSKNEMKKLPVFFDKACLNYTSDYPLIEVRNRILQCKELFSQAFISFITTNNWHSLVSRVYNYFKYEWDGAQVEPDGNRRNVISNISIPCYPCLSFVSDSEFNIVYRLHIDGNSFVKTIVDKFNFENGWSEELKAIPERIDKFRFNVEKRNFYILNSAVREDYFYYADMKALVPGEEVFILSKYDANLPNEFMRDDYYHNSQGWILSTYVVPADSDKLPECLKAYMDDPKAYNQLLVEGGAKVKNGYLRSLLPIISDELKHEIVLIDNENNEIQLSAMKRLDKYFWSLPTDLPIGDYKISDKDDNRRSVELSIVPTERSIELNQVKIDNEGKVVNDGAFYFQNNQIFGFTELDKDYPNYEYTHSQDDKYLCQYKAGISPDEDGFVPSLGDIFIDWLYSVGKVSKKEFELVFFGFKKKLRNSISVKIGTVIRMLRNQGFIELDRYDNIYPCSPRIVCLPVDIHHCNVVKLVGVRSLGLLREVETCCRQNNQFSFHYYKPDDKYSISRLAPSVIYLEVEGLANNNFGLDLIRKNICETLNIGFPDINLLRKFKAFIPSLKTFVEKISWSNYDSSIYSQFQDQYSSELFRCDIRGYEDPTTLEMVLSGMKDDSINLCLVNRSKTDKRILLIKKTGNVFEYCEIEDESLGKYYVLYLFLTANAQYYDRPVNDLTINCVKNDSRKIIYEGILATMYLPLIWEKLLGIMTINPPILCSIQYHDGRCPFIEISEGVRIIKKNCDHSDRNRCPYRYYLYDVEERYFNQDVLKTIIMDRLRFNYSEHTPIKQ